MAGLSVVSAPPSYTIPTAAGLSVVSAPPSYTIPTATPAQTFGAVQGFAQANKSFSGLLQGSGKLNNAAIAVPQPVAPQVQTFANTLPTEPIQVTKSTSGSVGPAPSFSQVYGGQVYTDPNALAQAQAANAFQPIHYNGQVFNDPTSYANAVIGDIRTTHDKNVGQIKTAYENGLITFDQKQNLIDQNRQHLSTQASQALDSYQQGVKALGTTRDQALQSQQGYFNSISPDAVQSQQGVIAGKTQAQYAQDLAGANTAKANNDRALQEANGSLDLQAQGITSDKQALQGQYQNNLQSADQAQQQGIDAANNSVTGQKANVQSILDAGQNAAISFKNQVAKYNADASNAVKANTTSFDPTGLAQNLASYVVNAQQIGLSADQGIQSAARQLATQGFNVADPKVQQILEYVYGQVTNPNTSYGAAYANKQPITAALGTATGQ